ncbi:hypothetical protein ACTFIU_011200 [Dictyostelium citrinum]
MEKTLCRTKVISPLFKQPYISTSQLVVGFNLDTDDRAFTSLKMYAVPTPYEILFGLDFMAGGDISTNKEGEWLIKYFNDTNRNIVKTSIPLYGYPIKVDESRKTKIQVGSRKDIHFQIDRNFTLLRSSMTFQPGVNRVNQFEISNLTSRGMTNV